MQQSEGATVAGLPAPRHGLTERQVQAVYEVMRLLRDDQAPEDAQGLILCRGCQRPRQRRGSVAYGEHLLCNGCATDYELLRIARSVQTIDDFLSRGALH